MKKSKQFLKILSAILSGLLVWVSAGTTAFAKAALADGTTVQITANQAITYPATTKNNIPSAACYPLPKGTMSKVSGKRISYKKNGVTHYYYLLSSGQRVNENDLKAVSTAAPAGNHITDLEMRRSNSYTYVCLTTDQKVAFTVTNSASSAGKISFTFQNTTDTPPDYSYSNGMIPKVTWEDSTMTLWLSGKNAFWGYKAYYDTQGRLIFRLNNKPASMSGLKVAIDAGHGGKDTGALGTKAGAHEKNINLAIAEKLVDELEERGAEVYLISGAGKEGQWRKEAAEDWGADVLVSIHCNSSTNKKATGTEVYYFHSYNKSLATAISASVSGSLNTLNRGGKQSFYHVTLSSQMKSVLVETGFISNASEYKKLIQKSYQLKIVAAIADALEKNLTAK
jgi:N-acetylmuramoyl-L-alanine amidase